MRGVNSGRPIRDRLSGWQEIRSTELRHLAGTLFGGPAKGGRNRFRVEPFPGSPTSFGLPLADRQKDRLQW